MTPSRPVRCASAVLLSVGLCGCATHADAVRARMATQFSCPENQVVVEALGSNSYRGTACGSTATYVCTGPAMPNSVDAITCVQETDVVGANPQTQRSSGGETPSGTGASPAPPPEPATPPPEHAGVTSPATDGAIRAALDGRIDILRQCIGPRGAVIEARVGADGLAAVSLRAPMAGTPEETCVQAAVGELRVEASSAGALVLHPIMPATP